MAKKPQINFQIEFEEKQVLDLVTAETGFDAPTIARALIRQLIRAYKESGRAPLRLESLIDPTEAKAPATEHVKTPISSLKLVESQKTPIAAFRKRTSAIIVAGQPRPTARATS